jgi:hypothetical protein
MRKLRTLRGSNNRPLRGPLTTRKTMSKVKIEITDSNTFDHERSMTFVQEIYTSEDFEYACTRAGLAWGFDEVFSDFNLLKVVKDDLN